MKRKGIVILCVMFATMLVFSAAAEDLVFGIKGGLGHFSYYGSDYSDVIDDPTLSNGLKLGLIAGLFVSIPVSDYVSIQPEFLIAIQGDKFREDADVYGPYDGYIKYIDNVPYLSLPVLFTYNLIKLSIFAGPDILIKLGAGKWKANPTDDALSSVSGEYTSDVFVGFGYALVAGVAYQLQAGSAGIVLDARFQLGLNNILDDDVFVLKQYAIIVMAGYRFGAQGIR